MRRAITYLLIAAVVVAAVLLVYRRVTGKIVQRKANTTVTNEAIPVAVTPVAERPFRVEVAAVGTLRARETALVSPKIPGHVIEVLVDIGSHVRAGQLLVRLDPTDFKLAIAQAKAALSAAEAGVLQATAQYEQAEKEHRRISDLLEQNVVPQSRYDAVEAAYKTAREALAAARHRRDQAQAALATAEQALQDTEIRSPITGSVVERRVEVGQAVEPAAQLFRIVDQTSLKMDVQLPETDLHRVRVGTRAEITVDSFPGKTFPGRVTVLNPMVDPRTRTFQVRITVPNPAEKLVDGAYARVKLFLGKRKALAVPREALQRLPGSGTYYVFVIHDNQAAKRVLKLGVMEDLYAEVLDGVSQGERVVTSGAGRLRSGVEVSISKQTDAQPQGAIFSDEGEVAKGD